MPHRLIPAWSASHSVALVLVAATAMIGGCAAQRPVVPLQTTPPRVSAQIEPAAVIRSGRYSLIEVQPQDAQRDLLRQVVDVTVPSGITASVADMMRYVLLRSGFTICEGAVVDSFEPLPLPAAHQHLGPIMLRDALDVLAGPAWHLEVDETRRQVCFSEANANPNAHLSTSPAEHTHEQ